MQCALHGRVASELPVATWLLDPKTLSQAVSHRICVAYCRRQHILAGALSALSGQQGLSSRAAADALAAVALLEGHDSAAALQAFLSARQQWVQQQLEQAAHGQAGEVPGDVLATLAQTVQSCVAQVRKKHSTSVGSFGWQQSSAPRRQHCLQNPTCPDVVSLK